LAFRLQIAARIQREASPHTFFGAAEEKSTPAGTTGEFLDIVLKIR
jgi:hypothetical protein